MAKAQTIVTQAAGLSQSGLMGAALVAAFVVWLAAKGKLGTYWSILLGGGSSGSSGSIIPGTTTPGTPGLSTNPFAGIPNPFGGSFWHDFIFGPSATPPAATPPATPNAGSK